MTNPVPEFTFPLVDSFDPTINTDVLAISLVTHELICHAVDFLVNGNAIYIRACDQLVALHCLNACAEYSARKAEEYAK